MSAAIDLINSIGGNLIECFVVVELQNIGWENRIKYKTTSILRY